MVKGGELCSIAGTKEAIIAYFDKPTGEDMLQKTANEFFNGQGAELGLASFGILIAKGHFAIFQFQDTVVVDSHSKNICGEILHGGLSIADRFAVHDPFLLPDRFGNVLEEIGLSQSFPELGSEDP